MADYSFFFLEEANISFTNGVTLDGITQGDGSQVVGEDLTISSLTFKEVFVSDGGGSSSNPDTNFADNDRNQVLDGDQEIGGVTYSSGTRIEAEYEFRVRDESTGLEYRIIAVNVANSSPIYGTSEGIAFVGAIPPAGVPLRVISGQEGPPNSGQRAVDADDILPICFCAGTRISTPTGATAVEHLRPGSSILRYEGTEVQLRHAFRTRVRTTDLQKNRKLQPVRITAGALGNGLPTRDLLVSRQHRMLVSSCIAERMFGIDEVLVAAIRLTCLSGVFIDKSVTEVDYFHLLFDAHEVIVAEGAPSESLFTGPEALKAIGPEARLELTTLFPELAGGTLTPRPARLIPTGAMQRKLVARHVRNNKAVLAPIG